MVNVDNYHQNREIISVQGFTWSCSTKKSLRPLIITTLVRELHKKNNLNNKFKELNKNSEGETNKQKTKKKKEVKNHKSKISHPYYNLKLENMNVILNYS